MYSCVKYNCHSTLGSYPQIIKFIDVLKFRTVANCSVDIFDEVVSTVFSTITCTSFYPINTGRLLNISF